ncbi:MAG: hypothetical protein IJY11_03500 [Clostridia bacterium]|nr:hypothetical protein [Clostridia bacterium]
MKKENNRFVVVHKEGTTWNNEGIRQLLVDKETGVTYLCWLSGYGASLTPLLDAEGKVVITKL